jgi:four helix bundle protein
VQLIKAAFPHEKLMVYRESVQFVAWATDLIENIPQRLCVGDQLDRASTSVPLNIAQGNSRYTGPDRCRYFDTARGSALECAACLDVLVARRFGTTKDYLSGKYKLAGVVSMLVGLIRNSSPDRLHEGEPQSSPPKPDESAHTEKLIVFDHEKLEAYQSSLQFIAWTADLLERFPGLLSRWRSMDRASTSVALNIAEGNGKFTSPDRGQFFDNARSATLDCAACLDVLVAKRQLSSENAMTGKQQLSRVHSMLVGLIRRNAPDRFQSPVSYRPHGGTIGRKATRD